MAENNTKFCNLSFRAGIYNNNMNPVSPVTALFEQEFPEKCCNNRSDNRCNYKHTEQCQCGTFGNQSRAWAPLVLYRSTGDWDAHHMDNNNVQKKCIHIDISP